MKIKGFDQKPRYSDVPVLPTYQGTFTGRTGKGCELWAMASNRKQDSHGRHFGRSDVLGLFNLECAWQCRWEVTEGGRGRGRVRGAQLPKSGIKYITRVSTAPITIPDWPGCRPVRVWLPAPPLYKHWFSPVFWRMYSLSRYSRSIRFYW